MNNDLAKQVRELQPWPSARPAFHRIYVSARKCPDRVLPCRMPWQQGIAIPSRVGTLQQDLETAEACVRKDVPIQISGSRDEIGSAGQQRPAHRYGRPSDAPRPVGGARFGLEATGCGRLAGPSRSPFRRGNQMGLHSARFFLMRGHSFQIQAPDLSLVASAGAALCAQQVPHPRGLVAGTRTPLDHLNDPQAGQQLGGEAGEPSSSAQFPLELAQCQGHPVCTGYRSRAWSAGPYGPTGGGLFSNGGHCLCVEDAEGWK